MTRFVLRQVVLILIALLLVNFIGFSYAHIALRFHQAQNPFGSTAVGAHLPILALYADYARNLLHLDFGQMPVGVSQTIAEAVAQAAGASLGLLLLVFALSMTIGLALGLWAVRVEPARIVPWLLPATSVGMSLPSFYIGILFVTASVVYVLQAGAEAKPPFPLQGFGWDFHLVLPVLALLWRPTVQIAQVTAGLLSDELGKPYIVAARSRGNTWARARWKHAFRNVLVPVLLTMAGSFRLLVGELILVEWLFAWPGLGRLLVLTLVAPRIAFVGELGDVSAYFLNPPLVAAVLPVFTLLFLSLDTLVSIAVRAVDPRLRIGEGDAR